MSVEKVIDIEYGTGNLKFDRVRTGVLQNKDKLTEMGYKCAWTGDLDLGGNLNPAELRERGYLVLDDCVLTSFDKEGLPFTITMFPRSQRAKIHGDNHVYQNEFDQVKQDYDRFEEATGIHLNLKQTSEPY